MEENTVRQVHTAVLSMYKGDHRATQWLNAFGRSKVCSIISREKEKQNVSRARIRRRNPGASDGN